MEQVRPSGLVVDSRSSFDQTPNPNPPASVPPATVGPPAAVPGDPHGVQVVGDALPPADFPPIRPSAWSGWPADWATPNWSNTATVERLTDTAWACLDRNASVLASMPPYLVDGSPNLPTDWLNNPDPDIYACWDEFAKQLFWDYQLGEAFVIATAYYASGYPARFHVAPPWSVSVDVRGDGSLRYKVGEVDVTADLLHVRYQYSGNEAHGHGPLEVGAIRLVAANALARYSSSLAAGVPNAVLKSAQTLTAKQAGDLQAAWVDARVSAMGLPAVLSGGLDFEVLQLSPKDMALVEVAQFNEARICALLGVPAVFMNLPSGGDSMTYTNVNMLFDYHWRAGLRPKASHVMGALSAWLTPRGTTLEVNRDEYTRPDLLERAQAYEILIRAGVLQAEQAAEFERFRFVPTQVPEPEPVTAGELT